MYKPGVHVYMAGPFFDDSQRDLCEFIEGLATTIDPIYSPRNDGFVLKPDATVQERDAIFRSNTVAIDTASWMLAIIDDFDPGTIWEMGYAHARGVPTLAYTDVIGRGLNVMLAGSASLGFVVGRKALTELFRLRSRADLPTPDGSWGFPRNTWAGEIQ